MLLDPGHEVESLQDALHPTQNTTPAGQLTIRQTMLSSQRTSMLVSVFRLSTIVCTNFLMLHVYEVWFKVVRCVLKS
jgi:hypothetical protein